MSSLWPIVSQTEADASSLLTTRCFCESLTLSVNVLQVPPQMDTPWQPCHRMQSDRHDMHFTDFCLTLVHS